MAIFQTDQNFWHSWYFIDLTRNIDITINNLLLYKHFQKRLMGLFVKHFSFSLVRRETFYLISIALLQRLNNISVYIQCPVSTLIHAKTQNAIFLKPQRLNLLLLEWSLLYCTTKSITFATWSNFPN